MSLLPCPTCGLPRVADDLACLACPVCGHREVPLAELTAAPEPVGEPVAPRSRLAPFAVFVALSGVAAAAILAVALLYPLGEQAVPLGNEDPSPGVEVAAVSPATNSAPSTVAAIVPELAPIPRFASELAPLPRVHVEVVARPRSVLGPLDDARVITIDRPKGDYELPVLRDGARVRLVGRVDRLVVRGIADGAALDAVGLSAREVVFAGPIEGGSTARVRTTRWAISFREKVDGESQVVAEAPHGAVTFLNESPRRPSGPMIDGGSQVTVAARLVVIGTVTGADTRVDVTLHPTTTAPSFLRVGLIDGPSLVRYRNAPGSTGKPKVLPGELRGGAVLAHDK
jgi:hypothetical protein